MFPAGAAGAAAGAAAAAAAKARQRREEEEMTGYRPEDLEGWEFKILRCMGARFGRPDRLRAVLAEEAEAGWELVEKFDNHRIRLKRRVEWREKDRKLPVDPYRSWVGLSDTGFVLSILGVVFGLIALGIAIAAIAH